MSKSPAYRGDTWKNVQVINTVLKLVVTPKYLWGCVQFPLVQGRRSLNFLAVSRKGIGGQNNAIISHKTNILGFRVARYSFLLKGSRVRELWRQLKDCRVPFFQPERFSSFSCPQGLEFLKHHEFKHVLERDRTPHH